MAVSIVQIGTPAGLTNYRNTDLDEVKDAIDATSGKLHALVVDNTSNVAASYVKLYDAASGSVTVGTTAPDLVLKIPASVKRTIVFQEGLSYGTALTAACVTTGGTAGTTAPSSAVILEALFE